VFKLTFKLATSGLLTCKTNDNICVAHTETYNFRMLIDYYENNHLSIRSKVAWQDSSIVCSARINKVIKDQGNMPDWAGFHLFGRYETENDLYVASMRIDGNVAIKKKKGSEYTTLIMKKGNIYDIGKIFQMRFDIFTNDKGGVSLLLFIDENLLLETQDNNNIIKNGTHGVRIDYCDADIFSLSIA
jgi:hypothetical protein